MAQPSVVNYFNTRKRPAVDEIKLNNAKKLLLSDEGNPEMIVKNLIQQKKLEITATQKNMELKLQESIVKKDMIVINSTKTPRKTIKATTRAKKLKPIENQRNIEQMFSKIKATSVESKPTPPINLDTNLSADKNIDELLKTPPRSTPNTPTKQLSVMDKIVLNSNELLKTPPRSTPSTPTKQVSAMDKIVLNSNEPTIAQLKQKLSRSSRLAELKASIARFKQSEKQLEEAEKTTKEAKEKKPAQVGLKDFKAIELEVHLSPQKVASPEKAYLSPKKDTSTARRSLFASPVKKELFSTSQDSLTLPYKYRYLAEIFRAIDTVSQILYNRKETITFKKLKPAVEEMLKRNLSEKHLAQIKHLYPEAFVLKQEKLRQFGAGLKKEQWELVLVPQIENVSMTAEVLLERRRKLFKILINKVKQYHQEFLSTLDPPMKIPLDKITRWHPQFDIERVPDVEAGTLPQPPDEEKLTTGSEVLEKARSLFNCNTRMERALEKLKQTQQEPAESSQDQELPQGSILKGIPKALLEKVRQRQAAKALESMTRSTDRDREMDLYSQLPEIARFTRNVFVTEKKGVLPLDLVLDKLCNSYRAFRSKNEMKDYLKTIAREIDGWLVFHEIRKEVFVKLNRNADLSLVMNKLKSLAEKKAS